MAVERISPTIRIVHSPGTLYARLEEAEMVPLRIKHAGSTLHPLPQRARTVFPRKPEVIEPEPEVREHVTLKRETTIPLHFPDEEVLEKFRLALLDRRCPVEVDTDNLTITFSRRYDAEVRGVIEALEDEYLIHVEDFE